MSVMQTILIALLSGTFGGTVAGVLAGAWTARRQHTEPSSDRPSIVDPDLDQNIDWVARRWAAEHHQPAAAPLVANKLRLAYALGQRRTRRHRRRWSR